MGELLMFQRRPLEAEPLLREALEGRRKVLPLTVPDTPISILNLGALMAQNEKIGEAISLCKEAREGLWRFMEMGTRSELIMIHKNSLGF